MPNPWFEEQAAQRGLVFQYQSGQSERYLFPEIMGGGAALADLDNDGDLDIYLVQGGELLTDTSPGNKLFLNVGDGRFEEVRGGGGAADTGYGMGVATGDYDNDGDVDLYVTNFGAVVSGVVGPTRFYRAVQTAGSYLAARDPRVHFGLGGETRIRDVVVRWPDGSREEFGDFDAGQWVDLRKGSGTFLGQALPDSARHVDPEGEVRTPTTAADSPVVRLRSASQATASRSIV